MVAIGIDLGTTNSCVSIYRNNQLEIIPNEHGERITPSLVSFVNNERIIGSSAKSQLAKNYKNTIYEVKRLMGKTFEEIDTSPFKYNIEDLGNNQPSIIIENGGPQLDTFDEIQTVFTPQQISAMILGHMKKIAENYIGQPVTDAVITVPAYFNDAQRQATKDAGYIAGLNVLRMINEPTAASIAYGLYDESSKEKIILVVDSGGGTCDISLLSLENGIFQVKSITGDTNLGGADFDNVIIKYIIEQFKKDHKVDIRTSPKAYARLRIECERAKKALTSTLQTDIEVFSILNGLDLCYTLTRSKFEALSRHLFDKHIHLIKNVLEDANIETVDEIVLVGGTTRIPRLQTLISQMFGNKELCKTINPDEAVAYGAGIQAAILYNTEHETDEQVPDILLLDVIPLSLGIMTSGDLMSILIPRNTTIPINKMKMFSTTHNNQTEVEISVYEGERTQCKYNHLLGNFTMTGITKGLRGEPKINVTFDVDANGILTVTAEENGNVCDITITNNISLNETDIEKMLQDSKKYENEDQLFKKRMIVKNNLENNLYTITNQLNTEIRVTSHNKEIIESLKMMVEEHFEWIEKVQMDFDPEDCEARLESIKELVEEISSQL